MAAGGSGLKVCTCPHVWLNSIIIPAPLSLCRLLPYGCLSTGGRVGFIEIVRKSETIANIQKDKKEGQKSKLFWDSSLLYAWLKEKNPTEPQLVVSYIKHNLLYKNCFILTDFRRLLKRSIYLVLVTVWPHMFSV